MNRHQPLDAGLNRSKPHERIEFGQKVRSHIGSHVRTLPTASSQRAEPPAHHRSQAAESARHDRSDAREGHHRTDSLDAREVLTQANAREHDCHNRVEAGQYDGKTEVAY